eukprot:s332_g41.t1
MNQNVLNFLSMDQPEEIKLPGPSLRFLSARQGLIFQGCITGLVELNPASQHWIGAKDHSSTDAELTAMALAQTIALQISPCFPVTVRPDLSFSPGLASRSMTSHHEYALPRLVHLLGQFCHSRVHVNEVRGHTQDPWNELADQLAKHALKLQQFHGLAPVSMLRSIVTLPDDLKWAWLSNMPASFSCALPHAYEGTVWQPATATHNFMQTACDSKPVPEETCIDFKLASLNALSIVDNKACDHNSARCLRLDQQFHNAGYAFLCMQETRTAEGQRVTDHYKILASGKEQRGRAHHYGCEIWINKILPICTGSDGAKLYLKDFKVTVLHASPRCLIARLNGPIPVTIVSAHAPCDSSARNMDEIRQWWSDFDKLIDSIGEDELLICGIDAKAPISGLQCAHFGTHDLETSTQTGELFQQFVVHHGNVRKRLAQEWTPHAEVIQYGGKAGHATDLAHHLLSMFVAWGRTSKTSVGLLSVDLRSAFYSVLRQSFFQGDLNDDLLCKALRHHGVLPQDWHQIRAQIEADAALDRIGIHAQNIIQDMFTAAHFTMEGVQHQVCTMRGTRPGDPVADVILNSFFCLILRDTRQHFQNLTGMQWLGSPCPPRDITSVELLPSAGFCDALFVDDAAYCVHTDTPDQLGPALQCLASCLHDVARLRGLQLNYAAGKTEAMMHFGNGSRKAKSKLWHQQHACLPVVTEHGTSMLRIVHEYKHLGSYIQDYAVNTKDAKARDLLHANRLRYVARMIQTAPTFLWQLLHQTHDSHAWPALTMQSADWLRRFSPRYVPEFAGVNELCSFISLHQSWAGMVKVALKPCLSFHAAAAKGLLWTLRMEAFVHPWSDYAPKTDVTQATHWQCGLCDQKFDSKRALAMHSRQMHQYRKWQKYSALDIDCLACGKRYFARSRLMSHLTTSTSCATTYKQCLPPAPEDMVDTIEEEERDLARALKSKGWRPSKAFEPVLRIPCVLLPPPFSHEAALMRSRWGARLHEQGTAFDNLVGFATGDEAAVDSYSNIVAFLGHTSGGSVAGHGGVFQRAGLAAIHAQIHIKSLVFVHFYSGYRRFGDLQWQIDYFKVDIGSQLLIFLGDLLAAAALLLFQAGDFLQSVAGFPEAADPKGHQSRTSKERLLHFADRIETQTVHPSTELGQLAEKYDNLAGCEGTIQHNLKRNMWSFFSFAFVYGMREKKQDVVVALVHKEMDGDRPLNESILFQYEVPTIGIGAWGLGHWSPQVVLIDLMGTCKQTSPALRKQLYSTLPGFYERLTKKFEWSNLDFAFNARVCWTCLDCPHLDCQLDERLAEQVKELLQAVRHYSFLFCHDLD